MITKEQVKSNIYIWGFYPAVHLLKEQQELENYENCTVIKQALDEVSEGREYYLSSKVDCDSMKTTYDNILKEFKNPDLIGNNMPYYIDEFKKSLKL